MKRLTLVVNCTGRKSIQPVPELQVRSLPQGSDQERFDLWAERVRAARPSGALQDLYQGDAWHQSIQLAKDATTRGYDVRLLVASAGLGLRQALAHVPAYSATFASGREDTVAHGADGVRNWWSNLKGLDSAIVLPDETPRSVLLVLSNGYARAMDEDLIALGKRGGDLLLVGGNHDVDGIPRIACDRALRAPLGGTVSGLSVRMARAWLGKSTGTGLYSIADLELWNQWVESVRHVEIFNREPVADDTVIQLIRDMRISDPGLSMTRGLRKLRSFGVACEQVRFGKLFHIAIDDGMDIESLE